MEIPNDFDDKHPQIVPVRVLACLMRDWLTVIVYPGVGLLDGGIPTPIPMEIVPFDLRMPNSEFDLFYDKQAKAYVQVIRRVSDCPSPQ